MGEAANSGKEREDREPEQPVLPSFVSLLMLSRFGAGAATMAYAGTLPYLLAEWKMSGLQAGSVQSAFNVCYAVSLFVSSWISDWLGPRKIYLWSNWLAALLLCACGLFAKSQESALVLFGALAFALGGAYTPAIMLVAQELPRAQRGSAVGLMLTGASLGYFIAIAICTSMPARWGYSNVWLLLGVVAFLTALAGTLAVRALPKPIHRLPEAQQISTAVLSKQSMLLTAGYTAHCWELLGAWAWVPAFLAFSLADRIEVSTVALGLIIAAALHMSGAASTAFGGWASDRWGQRKVLIGMAVAGACISLSIGWLSGLAPIIVIVVAAIYGFAVLGDSGVLSTAMANAVAPAHLGRVLALRSILGFGAGAVSPMVFGLILDVTNGSTGPPTQWGWAFATLGMGGILAAIAAYSMRDDREGARQRSRQ